MGRVRDRHWPLLETAGSVVRLLVENSQVTNKNHMLFMDRFYNSFVLFHLLKNELGVLAAGTVMPSRKHYPKELGRRLTECVRYEFQCRGALCAIAWKDRKPIHFLSNYHDPHIYVMKPITWQPSRIQTDGERQWAETVLCFIGGPR